MENMWIALIIAVVTGTLSPALLLWMTNRNKRQERLEAEARDDAREARTQASLEKITKQTDGVLSQVAALAQATGHIEGGAEAKKVAEGTAAALLEGQRQGRADERESAAAKIEKIGNKPLPVADERTATAAEKTAAATGALADATARVADAAETKAEPKK